MHASRTSIGFHASHEQWTPKELLHHVKRAAQAGFRDCMCSDHFNPWSELNGNSGYAWSWLASALEATTMSFGTVCSPGQRYHPAIIAQAAATLCEMYPNRFWLALGSGEALNEHITGDRWPPKEVRQERLLESVEVMRALWKGETVTHVGHIRIKDARLYVRPKISPLVIGAALSPETAHWVGGWADGLITVSAPPEKLRKTVQAFCEGGGEGKPLFLQVVLAYAESEEQALRAAATRWRFAALPADSTQDLAMPADFDRAAANLSNQDISDAIRISSDLDMHRSWIEDDLALGFTKLFLHQVGPDVDRFISDFSEKILPIVGRRPRERRYG